MKAAALTFAIALVFAAIPARSVNVLYFRDAPIGADRMAEALAASGHVIAIASDAADFQTRIESGAFDIGVFFVQKRAAAEYAAAIQSLSAFVNTGGRALYADWSQNSALAAQFGAGFTGRGNETRATLLDLDPAATPVSDPILLRHTGWFRSTMGLTALLGSSAGASFENGDAAIVRGPTGRSLVFGFLSDTLLQAAIFQRGIEFVLAPAHRPAITQADGQNTPELHATTLRGTVLPNHAATSVVVEYGLTADYGAQTAAQQIGDGIDAVPVSTVIAGLPPHTTYHYRFHATNSAGVASSADHIFTTLDTPPIASNDRLRARDANPITIRPLSNDKDADEDAIEIISVEPASFGSVAFTANTLTYTPGATGLRPDWFTYTISDGFGGTATADVTIDMPLESFAGHYSQLIDGPGGVAGRMQFALGATGVFTGRVLLGDRNIVLFGRFGRDGFFRRTDRSGLAIALELWLVGATPHIVATIGDGATTWISDAARAGLAPPTFGQNGRYTFAVPDSLHAGIPRGDAWAMFAGNAGGRLRFIGGFADGAAFSGDGAVQPAGSVPLYVVRLAPRAQSLAGVLQFSDARGSALTGDFTWTRFGGANGFAVTSSIVGGRFVPPAAGAPIFAFRKFAARQAKATLLTDVAGFPRSRIFNVSASRIEAANPGAAPFFLQFSRTTGRFAGSFDDRAFGRCSVNGVFVRPANAVRGNFAGRGVSGSFLLAPR